MAYTKAPSTSTYSSERVDFVVNPTQRSAGTPTKDSRLLNMMVEVLPSPSQENTRALIKSRPGLSLGYSLSSGTARGTYLWVYNNLPYFFAVVSNRVTVNGTLLTTLTTSTGNVGFTEHVNSTGTVTLFLADGTKGYVFTSPLLAPTTITDANFPSPHVPIPIFLDGYIFLAKSNSQDVYNSQLDLPLSWSEGGTGGPMYISAEMYPDTVTALSKNNNYIYAIGRNNVEYFYDAAISTGSPLARQADAVQQFGTAAPFTVVQTEKEVILVGETSNGGYTVWTIDGFKEKEISIPSVRSILLAEGTALPNAVAGCVRVSGQKLYILKLSTRTLVYSFDTQLWSEWASGTNNVNNFLGRFFVDGPNGSAIVLVEDGSALCTMSENIFFDLGSPIYCQVTTPKYDFGTVNRKFMSRFSLVGNVPDATDIRNDFTIEWTDDDYRTWSTPRTLTFNYDFPTITQLGNFRRRAFRITYSAPYLAMLEGIEVDINKGSQ